jgi:ketosteroid isomerase-like protein
MSAPSVEHPHVASYRRMMGAFNANDLSTVNELVAADVEYVVPGRSPLAGRTHDIAGLLGMLRRSKELSGGTLTLDPHAVVADSEFLFVYGRIHAERNGKTLDSEHCVVFRFLGGKIVSGRTVPVDLYEFDAFWT